MIKKKTIWEKKLIVGKSVFIYYSKICACSEPNAHAVWDPEVRASSFMHFWVKLWKLEVFFFKIGKNIGFSGKKIQDVKNNQEVNAC